MPLTTGFVYAEANNIDSVKSLLEENKCCAIMFEVVQGEGGVLPLSKEFVSELSNLALEQDILLIVDEVQTGNGRTGKLYGYMNYGITPDVVSTAKGLAGGLPMGATLLGDKVENVLGVSMHGSTFGGNPVCAAGALNILSRIDEELLSGVNKRSNFIFDSFSSSKGVIGVSGLGLMIGIECERPANEIIDECRENGVLIIKAKNKLRLLPALNIEMCLLEKAVNIIKESCAK